MLLDCMCHGGRETRAACVFEYFARGGDTATVDDIAAFESELETYWEMRCSPVVTIDMMGSNISQWSRLLDAGRMSTFGIGDDAELGMALGTTFVYEYAHMVVAAAHRARVTVEYDGLEAACQRETEAEAARQYVPLISDLVNIVTEYIG